MKLSTKIAVLAIVLAADLLFFFFLETVSPSFIERIFQNLPWSDNVEKTVAIIAGLAIAVVTSSMIVYVLFNYLFRKEYPKGGEK